MTPSDDAPRRPTPATGRQDRHRPAAPPAPEFGLPAERAEPVGHLPPRGAAHYAKGRSQQLGLGCLVALFVVGAGLAVILLALGLSSNNEFVPAGVGSPAPSASTSPLDSVGPDPDTGAD